MRQEYPFLEFINVFHEFSFISKVQIKLKSGSFPQIDTSKVFVKHKVAKPKRKHVVESPSQAKHKVSKPKHKKGEAKHAIAHKHRKIHGRKKKEIKAARKAKLHHKREKKTKLHHHKKKHHVEKMDEESS